MSVSGDLKKLASSRYKIVLCCLLLIFPDLCLVIYRRQLLSLQFLPSKVLPQLYVEACKPVSLDSMLRRSQWIFFLGLKPPIM